MLSIISEDLTSGALSSRILLGQAEMGLSSGSVVALFRPLSSVSPPETLLPRRFVTPGSKHTFEYSNTLEEAHKSVNVEKPPCGIIGRTNHMVCEAISVVK